MIFILIQIKFDIEINNNNELLKKNENIRKIKIKIITCNVQQCRAQVTNNLSSSKLYLLMDYGGMICLCIMLHIISLGDIAKNGQSPQLSISTLLL